MFRPRVSFHCKFCGADNFRGPRNPGPDDLMLCASCGKKTPYGELEDARAKRLKQNRDIGARGFFDKR